MASHGSLLLVNIKLLRFFQEMQMMPNIKFSDRMFDRPNHEAMKYIVYFLLSKLFPDDISTINWPILNASDVPKFCKQACSMVDILVKQKGFPPGLFRKSVLSSASKSLYKPLWLLSLFSLEKVYCETSEMNGLRDMKETFETIPSQLLPNFMQMLDDQVMVQYETLNRLQEKRVGLLKEQFEHEIILSGLNDQISHQLVKFMHIN